jgi:hypothetical protein
VLSVRRRSSCNRLIEALNPPFGWAVCLVNGLYVVKLLAVTHGQSPVLLKFTVSKSGLITVDISSLANNAYLGLRLQQQRLNDNVSQVSSVEATSGRDTSTQDRALMEQIEIVSALRANARSLQAAQDRVGTIIDLKA